MSAYKNHEEIESSAKINDDHLVKVANDMLAMLKAIHTILLLKYPNDHDHLIQEIEILIEKAKGKKCD